MLLCVLCCPVCFWCLKLPKIEPCFWCVVYKWSFKVRAPFLPRLLALNIYNIYNIYNNIYNYKYAYVCTRPRPYYYAHARATALPPHSVCKNFFPSWGLTSVRKCCRICLDHPFLLFVEHLIDVSSALLGVLL